MSLTLKPLSRDAIPAALAKAERYRLIDEPEQAESICEDILRAEPGNRDALVTLILALTDQFKQPDGGLAGRAQALVNRLDSPYERAYYAGIIAERRARAQFHRGGPGAARPAADWLQEAMRAFEQAEALRPAGNDDALLRWNACARFAMRHPQLAEGRSAEVPEPMMLE